MKFEDAVASAKSFERVITMQVKTRSIAVLMLIMFITTSLSAQPYLGFSRGKATNDGQKSKFHEISIGTSLGSRVNGEVFMNVQQLGTQGTFAVTSGLKTSVTLFRDATVNPMVEAGVGHLAIGVFDSCDTWPALAWYPYTTIAGGFELNVSDSFSMSILKGYRYAPNEPVYGLKTNQLSGQFTSLGIKAILTDRL